MLRVEGASVEDAFARANHLMLANRWGDGLPLWPPTRERVGLDPARAPRSRAGATLGTFPPRGGVTTVETCAIALAMAGGRPEYLPVLVAAVEAFLDPESGSEQLQAASGSAFPVVIVNGPIGAQIRLNAGFGCLGPDPQRPAGASIGRALRLLQQNVGGALPGIGTMANYGGMRYTNVVFAEDEANLPAGWAPHGTERHGFAPGTSSISLAFANGATNIRRRGAKKETPEEDALQGMHRMADFMRVPNMPGLAGYEHGTPGHPDDPGRGGPDHGRPRLDQGVDPRVPLGALADPGRGAAARGMPGVDRDRREQGGAREPRPRPVADHRQPRQLRDRRGRRRPPDQQLLAAGLQPRRRRPPDRACRRPSSACSPRPSATSGLASERLSALSACSSQYCMPISRYIVVATVRCSFASRLPVRA